MNLLTNSGKITDKESNRILYVLKGFAIISAVSAHCTYKNSFVATFSGLIGTIGVPIFFILAGYFFNYSETSCSFWKKKAKRIIFPWLLWGLITYWLPVFLGHSPQSLGLSIRGCVLWTLGYNTWLYFVPMLLCCFILCRLIHKRWFLIACIIAGITSITFSVYDIFPLPFITKYQNPFNWIAFFSLGILLRGKNVQDWKKNYSIACFLGMLLCGSAYFIPTVCDNIEPGYWSCLSIPFELFSAGTLLGLSKLICKAKYLEKIGHYTYPIFFAHMQFGMGIIQKLLPIFTAYFPILDGIEIPLFRPVAVVFVTYVLFKIGESLLSIIKLSRYKWIFGI